MYWIDRLRSSSEISYRLSIKKARHFQNAGLLILIRHVNSGVFLNVRSGDRSLASRYEDRRRDRKIDSSCVRHRPAPHIHVRRRLALRNRDRHKPERRTHAEQRRIRMPERRTHAERRRIHASAPHTRRRGPHTRLRRNCVLPLHGLRPRLPPRLQILPKMRKPSEQLRSVS